MINRALRQALLKRLGVTPAALSYKAKRIKDTLSMTTEQATYILAHQSGLDLTKYLSKTEVESQRSLESQLAIVSPNSPAHIPKNPHKASNPRVVKVLHMPDGKRFNDPILPADIHAQAVNAAQTYPFLYILENSIRTFIVRAMLKYHGPNWWEEQVRKTLRDNVDGRKRIDKRNSWHQARGARNIDYLDFNDLKELINKVKSQLCKDDVIPAEEWINILIDEIYPSRCVLAHMNPLSKTSITRIQLRFTDWENQIKGHLGSL